MTMRSVLSILLVAALAEPGASSAAPASPGRAWGFRGDGTGRFPDASPPLEWGVGKNIVWTTKIGPNKYSSPIVIDRRIFLVAEPALLLCVDAADGRILWQRSNGYADLPEKVDGKPPRGDAGNTTPTPVSDGQYVYAVFGTGIVACYDLKGERRWIRYGGPCPAPEYGRSSSPALVGGKLLVTLSCLMALDARTGEQAWKNREVPEQYGTPIPAQIGGVDVAVLPSGHVVRVSDGTILASELGGLQYASPVVQDGAVYLIQAGASAQQLSASAGGTWQAKQLWEQELDGTYYASALFDKGLIYAVSNAGDFYILDSRDGKIVAHRELDLPRGAGRPGASGANLYPSLVMAGNCLMLFNDQGDTLVLEPGREYRELRRNHLGAGHGSAPAFDGRYIYMRGDQNLYCIGEPAPGR
jgi:outer membrane protein assembly factor BamB